MNVLQSSLVTIGIGNKKREGLLPSSEVLLYFPFLPLGPSLDESNEVRTRPNAYRGPLVRTQRQTRRCHRRSGITVGTFCLLWYSFVSVTIPTSQTQRWRRRGQVYNFRSGGHATIVFYPRNPPLIQINSSTP